MSRWQLVPDRLAQGGEMDALDLLKQDHDRIKPLLSELKETTDRAEKTRGELFSRIKEELTVHEIIEEEIFYPRLKEHPKAKEIVLEGYEEHDVVSRLMGELDGMDATDEAFGPKAKVMAENIEHHIEEEEGEMFRQARQVFEADELDALGERMARRKESARHELYGAVR
jgi:hemerythrin-like domain-containing protein